MSFVDHRTLLPRLCEVRELIEDPDTYLLLDALSDDVAVWLQEHYNTAVVDQPNVAPHFPGCPHCHPVGVSR